MVTSHNDYDSGVFIIQESEYLHHKSSKEETSDGKCYMYVTAI